MMIEVMDSNNLKIHLKGDETSFGDVAKTIRIRMIKSQKYII